jgi:hypothetical protein
MNRSNAKKKTLTFIGDYKLGGDSLRENNK